MNKKLASFDVIVVGGGTAGSICAIAAARQGLQVAIVESNNFLGGLASGSGLAEMNAAGFQGKPLYGGIEKEIFDEMIANDYAAYHFAIPMSSNKNVKIDRLRYNPEILKIVLEQKALDAGVHLFYGVTIKQACENQDHCLIYGESRNQQLELQANYLIDATGNCQLADLLGYATTKPNVDALAVSTLLFRLSNFDLKQLNQAIEEGQLSSIMQEGYSRSILKGKILAFSPIPGTNDVSVNATRAKIDHEDIVSITHGMIEARRQILPIVDFIKQQVPGAKQAYISNIAPIMGIRDSRKLIGEYQLTLDDLESMKNFDDTIAIGCYPMDIHDPVTNAVIWKVMPGVYRIPYRSLLPKNAKRVLVVGKCISADEKAFAAIRVMPIAMNIGESAGYAVAIACKNNQSVSNINVSELKDLLVTKGIQL